MGFHPLAAVGRFVQKKERDSYMQKEKQYKNNTQNIEYTKQKTKIQNTKKNIQRILENISLVTRR